MQETNTGLESVYRHHHEGRGEGFGILLDERGAFIRRHVGKGKMVLDIGCRDGELTATYCDGNTVTGTDIDRVALAQAKARLGINTVHADLNGEWPFKQDSYDVVVACEVLEHMYFPRVVFEKVRAVLKKGGVFVGSVPHAYSMQSRVKFLLGIKNGTPLEDPTHINQFSYNEFRSLLEEQFIIQELKASTPQRYRLLAKVAPYAFAHDLMFAVTPKA